MAPCRRNMCLTMSPDWPRAFLSNPIFVQLFLFAPFSDLRVPKARLPLAGLPVRSGVLRDRPPSVLPGQGHRCLAEHGKFRVRTSFRGTLSTTSCAEPNRTDKGNLCWGCGSRVGGGATKGSRLENPNPKKVGSKGTGTDAKLRATAETQHSAARWADIDWLRDWCIRGVLAGDAMGFRRASASAAASVSWGAAPHTEGLPSGAVHAGEEHRFVPGPRQ